MTSRPAADLCGAMGRATLGTDAYLVMTHHANGSLSAVCGVDPPDYRTWLEDFRRLVGANPARRRVRRLPAVRRVAISKEFSPPLNDLPLNGLSPRDRGTSSPAMRGSRQLDTGVLADVSAGRYRAW